MHGDSNFSLVLVSSAHLILLDEGNVEVEGRLWLPPLLAAEVPDDLLDVPRLDLDGEPRPLLALLAARDARVVHGEEGPLEVAPAKIMKRLVCWSHHNVKMCRISWP